MKIVCDSRWFDWLMTKMTVHLHWLPVRSDGVHNEENTFTNMQSSHQTMLIHSHSNPDLVSTFYDDLRSSDYPEHVLKVYKPDQTCKYLLVHKETTAHEVVMLALQEFGITDSSSHFSLCEVSVAEGGIIKQRRLPDQLQNLAERIGLSSRWVFQIGVVNLTELAVISSEMCPAVATCCVRQFLFHSQSKMSLVVKLYM